MSISICNPISLEKDTWVACPFDSNHIMHQSSFIKHIINCRDKFPDSGLVTCPYNSFSYLLPENMEEHIEMFHYYEKVESKKSRLLRNMENKKYSCELRLKKPINVDDATYYRLLNINFHYEGILGMPALRDIKESSKNKNQ